MPLLIDELRAATRSLAEAGIADPEIDARLLLLAATGLDRVTLIRHPDLAMATDASARLGAWLTRRIAREPVSRILGRRDFWGLTLRITRDVLDPRPDTETLVEAVLRRLGDRRSDRLRILDLGTGSGAILCALLSEMSGSTGWGVDRSSAACAVARYNLDATGVGARSLIVQADWTTPFAPGGFDVVVSNPPYIETADIDRLDLDVRDYDPRLALDGGPDGLDAYRRLVFDLPVLLAPTGVAALEVGRGQADAVTAMMVNRGFTSLEGARDLAGIDRVVLGSRLGPLSGRHDALADDAQQLSG